MHHLAFMPEEGYYHGPSCGRYAPMGPALEARGEAYAGSAADATPGAAPTPVPARQMWDPGLATSSPWRARLKRPYSGGAPLAGSIAA
jgi:hypothetical protein